MTYKSLASVIREVVNKPKETKRIDQEELHKKLQTQNKIIDNA